MMERLDTSPAMLVLSLLGPGLAALWPVWLTVVRLLGLALTAPLLASPALPWRLRVGLAIVIGTATGLSSVGHPAGPPPAWPAGLWTSAGELVIGAALGLGVSVVLAGLDVAATLLELQFGLTPAVGGPSASDGHARTPTGDLLATLGALIFLVAGPWGGDLWLLRSVLDSLRTLPVGTALEIAAPVQFVHDLVLTALLLGLQVAAPVVVSIGLVQAISAMLARGRGGGLWQGMLSPVRLALGIALLATTLTGVGERVESLLSGVSATTAARFEVPPAIPSASP